jgi:bifunctional non-homologous end joining protein LigD
MKASPAEALPQEPGWLFEIKFDGIRAITVKNGNTIQLYSRRPRELTAQYPEIVEELGKLAAENAVLDGEIVALDDEGRSSFQLLQNRARDRAVRPRICYYLFDVLHLDGEDVTALPLRRRKQLLQTLLRGKWDKLRLSPALEGAPEKIWKKTKALGLEGIVAKRKDSKYEPDRRGGAWRKIKTGGEQEFVIGGYTAPKGSRLFFGALLVGYYKNEQFTFASKVGTGFDDATLKSLYDKFQKLNIAECPFQAGISGEFGRPELRRCSWLKPHLVCQIKFSEWTTDGKLRQPVFLGLRDDKGPKEVIQELPSKASVD